MELNVLELKDKLDSKKITLIDVREDYEVKICHINNSKHISMNQIPNNLDQLDKKNRYAIICHSGVRSLAVTQYLVSLGYNVKNVIGGIDEWALKVEKTMERY